MKYSRLWGGPTVTIVPTANAHIWGVIWKINSDDVVTLDNQRDDDALKYDGSKYFPLLKVSISTTHMGSFNCRVYQQKYNPLPRGDKDEIPLDQRPSKTYKKIMLLAAAQQGLPAYYTESLKAMQHNGEEGIFKFVDLLKKYSKEETCDCEVPGLVPRIPLKLDLRKRRKLHSEF